MTMVALPRLVELPAGMRPAGDLDNVPAGVAGVGAVVAAEDIGLEISRLVLSPGALSQRSVTDMVAAIGRGVDWGGENSHAIRKAVKHRGRWMVTHGMPCQGRSPVCRPRIVEKYRAVLASD